MLDGRGSLGKCRVFDGGAFIVTEHRHVQRQIVPHRALVFLGQSSLPSTSPTSSTIAASTAAFSSPREKLVLGELRKTLAARLSARAAQAGTHLDEPRAGPLGNTGTAIASRGQRSGPDRKPERRSIGSRHLLVLIRGTILVLSIRSISAHLEPRSEKQRQCGRRAQVAGPVNECRDEARLPSGTHIRRRPSGRRPNRPMAPRLRRLTFRHDHFDDVSGAWAGSAGGDVGVGDDL